MKIIFTIILLLLPLSIQAIDAEQVSKEVADNVASEFAACAAYFAIVSEAVMRSGKKDISSQYNKIKETAMDYSLISAKTGRTEEMAIKVTLARVESFMKGMSEDIGMDISNISILSNEYAFKCKSAMEKPETFIENIQNKVIQKYTTKKR